MNIFFPGVILLLASGFFALFFADKFKVKIVTFLSAIAAVLCCIPSVKVIANSCTMIETFNFNHIFGPVNFVIDPLSAFFILVISVMSLASTVYANGYLKGYIESGKRVGAHLIFLSTLTASMLLVVTCQNALMFLICWEIMSLSSFFLVIFENEKKEILKAGIKYLVFMHISVIFIILAFAVLSIKAGSFDFSSFRYVLENNSHLANIVFILAFIGFGTKSGFVPFHNWLPDAHPGSTQPCECCYVRCNDKNRYLRNFENSFTHRNPFKAYIFRGVNNLTLHSFIRCFVFNKPAGCKKIPCLLQY